MSLATLIANTRKVLAGDAAKGHVVFAAQGTLVGVTEGGYDDGRAQLQGGRAR